MDTVALVECRGDLEGPLKEAISLIGGIDSLGSPLVVKPNICTGEDETGVPNVKASTVETMVDFILDENPETTLRVVESDSMMKFAAKAFVKYGYTDLVERLKGSGVEISLHDLSNEELKEFDYEGYYFKKPELPRLLDEVGGFVSVALAKTHGLTVVTGALKNLFGLLPRKTKMHYHKDIHEVILDLNLMFRSGLCLIDGRVGLEGVTSGTPVDLGCVILGRSPVAVDATMARVMGFDPHRIRHLVEAADHGLGSLDPVVVGDDVENRIVKYNPPKNLRESAWAK